MYLKKTLRKKPIQKLLPIKEFAPFGFILLYIEFISFIFLADYPWVSVGDEVRDGGWQAMQIANGTLTNIFAYGRYDAHGLIIPTISSFFYYIFGSSVMTYRFPSALLACMDIVILYILVRLVANKTAAFFSSLILASLSLHIFYFRTQIVDAFSFFWTSSLFLFLLILLKKHRNIDYIFYGTLSGFVFGFHSSVRVVAILLLFILSAINISQFFHHLKVRKNLYTPLIHILLLCGFCFVGFGPRLVFTNTTNFFHTSRFVLEKNLESNIAPQPQDIQTIGANYIHSLLVWMFEPTTSVFYMDLHPLLPPVIAGFFLLGIWYSLFVLRQQFFYILIFLSLTIPFFSSAITDNVNKDHRILPLLTIGSIFAGIGVFVVVKLFRNFYVRFAVSGIIIFYIISQMLVFFMFRPADKSYKFADFVAMHAVYYLKTQPLYQNHISNICLLVSPDNSTLYNYPHYQEQFQYFFPHITTTVKPSDTIADNEIYIFNGDCPVDYRKTTIVDETKCNTNTFNFSCPLHYNGTITIHY